MKGLKGLKGFRSEPKFEGFMQKMFVNLVVLKIIYIYLCNIILKYKKLSEDEIE